MKKSYFGLLLAALVTLGSCNKEMEGPNGPAAGVEDDGNSVYFNVALSLPTDVSTRASTEGDKSEPDGNYNGDNPSDQTPTDFEYGYDYENQVRSLLLVIADEQDNFLLYSDVQTLPLTQQGTATGNPADKKYQVSATAKFSRNKLKALYETGILKTNQNVRLYAYCNYTSALYTYISGLTPGTDDAVGGYKSSGTESNTHWLNKALQLSEVAGSVTAGPIWGKNAFLMTNALIKTAQFPKKIDSWQPFTKESNPFDLSGNNTLEGEGENPCNNEGAIKVERAAARIDFKDAAPDGVTTYKLKGNYTVYDEEATETNNKTKKDINLFTIKFTDMSLVNMSNGYYALRRVSADGTSADWNIGWYETKDNYVVDTDWDSKDDDVVVSTVRGKFNYPMFKDQVVEGKSSKGSVGVYEYDTENWFTQSMTTVLAGSSDTWQDKQYKIWRYVTENTIPGGSSSSNNKDLYQKVGYSTGVVFRARILAGDDITAEYVDAEGNRIRFVSDKVAQLLASNNNSLTATSPELYMFNNLYYAGFEDFLAEAYAEGEGGSAHIAANDILGHWIASGESKDFVFTATPPATIPEGSIQLTVDLYYVLRMAQSNEWTEKIKDNEGNEVDNPLSAIYADRNSYTFDSENNIDFVENLNFKNTVTAKNFTIYTTEQGSDGKYGYYCYYFYWNRHNDNQNNSFMGPMEFATVRNNVYKLSVTKVGRLGHPTRPKNDPDPVEPDDPDESDDLYMTAEIQVLPWVVRVNNIEF